MKDTSTRFIGRLLLVLCFLFTGYRSLANNTAGIMNAGRASSQVVSVTRLNTSPANSQTVTYAVTFDMAVTGVTASAFGLTTSGSITGVAISGVSGSGTSYTVAINTGTGDGTLRLNVTGLGVTPAVTNTPYTSGEVYTIDRSAPAGSITINNGNALTNTTSVTLGLTATDASSVQMQFSNDGTSWSGYEALASTKGWTIPTGDGLKTVYVQYQDALGNVSGAYSATITLDQTVPAATITSTPPSLSNSASANFTFVSNDAGSTFQVSVDGSSFLTATSPYNINGFTSGPHSVLVRAKDPAGNFSTPVSYNWTVDLIAPVVSSVTTPSPGYYVIGSLMNFKVNFSENIQIGTGGGFPPYLNVTLASGSVKAYVTALGNNVVTFTYIVADGDADPGTAVVGTLQTNGGYIRDYAGNDANLALQNVGSNTGVIVNTARPTVSLSTTEANRVNHALTATITFSEAVSGFTMSDVTPVNANITSLTTTDNITYNVSFTPIAEGTVQISVPANVAVNVAGNPNKVSGTLTFTYDLTPPAITSITLPADGYYKAGSILSFTFDFGEDFIVSAASYLNVTIGSNTVAIQLSAYTPTWLRYDYTVVAGDQDMDGITVNGISLNGGTLKDAAGNNAILTMNNIGSTANVKVNTTHPTVSLSAAASPVNGPFTATVTFSEAVTGFIAGDLVSANATFSNLQTSDNITFTVLVTPTAAGNVSVNLPANAALNIGGNGNSAAATLGVVYDITPPAVTSVSVPADGYYQEGNNLDYTVNYNEAFTLNTTGGNPYLNITVGSTVVQASLIGSTSTTLTFRYTVVDGDLDMDGVAVNSLVLNGSTIKDAAGNNAWLTLNAIANSTNVKVNTIHATVVVSAPESIVNAPYTATIIFSEAVTGFALTDLAVNNATVSNLQTSDNTTYTVLVTPVIDGAVKVSVPANVALNIGSNGNAASNTLTVTYDGTPPTVTSVGVPANGYYKAADKLDFTVNYNEDVVVSGTPYINVTLSTGVVKANYLSGSGTNALVFEYTVVDGDQDMDGVAPGTALQLNGGTIKDVAGNDGVNTLTNVGNTTGVLVNTTHPTVTLSSSELHTLNHAITFTVTFSEAVTGFTPGDLAVTNGTITALSTSNNITFSATVTPITDGAVVLSVPAAVAKNVAGNDNQASTNTLNFTYDVIAPVVTSVDVPADKYYQESDVLTFKVNFSEPVLIDATIAKPYLDVTIGSTVVKAYASSVVGSSVSFNYTVANGDQDMDGISIGNIVLNSNFIQDTAKNNANLTLNNTGSTSNVFVNTTHPSVTITKTGASTVNAPFTATVTFSEAVTGFALTALTTTNATVSDLQTTDGITYTVLVTPTAEGAVQVGVPAGVAVNIANNENTAAPAALNVTYDLTKPSVTISTTAAIRVNATFAVKMVFSEAVTGLTASDLSVTNGTVGNLQTTDGITYTADITPTIDGLVSVSVPAAIAQDVATNPNTASGTVSLTYDITAPVITAGQTYEVSEKAAVNTVVGTVVASDLSNVLQDWTITGDDTGGAFSIDNNGVIHVKDAAILRSKVNTVAQVTITVSDALNISIPVSVAITIRFVNQAPTLDAISSAVMCTNTAAHTIQLTGASAVETDQTYSFAVSADKPNFDVLSVSAVGLITYQLKEGASGITTVTVTIKDNGGTDNGGVDTLRRTFTVTANSLPVISISSDKGSTISKGEIIHLSATGGTSYSWDNAAGNISGEQTDVLEAKPMDNTTYSVTVSNAAGCIDSATISVNVVEDFKVDAINIFTPNGDGKNDKWVIRNIDSYPNNEVKIFDRTGRLLYSRKNYDNEWGGTVNGAPLAEGTYYYVLTIEGGKTAKGYITIVRDKY